MSKHDMVSCFTKGHFYLKHSPFMKAGVRRKLFATFRSVESFTMKLHVPFLQFSENKVIFNILHNSLFVADIKPQDKNGL